MSFLLHGVAKNSFLKMSRLVGRSLHQLQDRFNNNKKNKNEFFATPCRASSYEYVYEFNSNKANIEASVAGTNATPRIRNMFSVSSVRGSLANGRFTRDTERKCVQDPIFDSKPLLNLNSLIFKSITIITL